jgi:hypothetical protein
MPAKKQPNALFSHKRADGLDNAITPEYASQVARVALEVSRWPKVDTKDINALYERLDLFISYCIENGLRIGNMGVYAALGIAKQTADDWDSGNRGPQKSDFIKKVKQICSLSREYYAQSGEINPILAIFYHKVHDNLVDNQEIVISQRQNAISDRTPEEIVAKYVKALGGDTD